MDSAKLAKMQQSVRIGMCVHPRTVSMCGNHQGYLFGHVFMQKNVRECYLLDAFKICDHSPKSAFSVDDC